MSTRILYQLPLSHYCEKTRWNLDAKGLSFETRTLFPGPHARFGHRVAGSRMLPILREGERYIADSTHIALYLEQVYPERPLIPSDPAEQARVLELEDYFDSRGDHIRRWIWAYLIDGDNFRKLLFDAYPLPVRLSGYALTPVMRLGVRRRYKVFPKKVTESYQLMQEGLGRLEDELRHDPTRYLVGDRFTLADLTAAAMYAPLIGPLGTPWDDDSVLPLIVRDLRDACRERVAGQWLTRVYAELRRP